jgi:hypothetical protein
MEKQRLGEECKTGRKNKRQKPLLRTRAMSFPLRIVIMKMAACGRPASVEEGHWLFVALKASL